ncbi:hypothetical protein LTR36_006317 [Oleoguttula mirabilis]|uniref:GED domain-containing protein n=1 Tax=Oleoguttula mirabilis TaxID=1507867 RepID=A0AAV9JW72_9PEZI|nr:hypothetical protein LTR36_006317 [Oleoguttula mirabilis]
MTRSGVKQEPHENHNEPTAPAPQLPSRPISISSTTTAMNEERVGSSDDTIRDEDVDMEGIHGAGTRGADDRVEDFNSALHVLQGLGKDIRELNTLIRSLEALGIKANGTSLPKLVIVGDQSAGKSSIVEGLTNTNLPRSEGTCTRCPYRITTTASRDGTWSCKVSLFREYSVTDKPREDPNDLACFDYWMGPHEPHVDHFATITDESDLGHVLRQAQLAILNPSIPVTAFSKSKAPLSGHEVNFSPNVVRLDIEGPGLPDTSFYDLPGAFNLVRGARGKDYLVDFIRQLIQLYVTDEKALILFASSIEKEIDMDLAFRYIKDADAVDRCMGVLTKPDLLTGLLHNNPKREGDVLQLLQGDDVACELGHGWYVTKQLSPAELSEPIRVTHAEARRREQAFFERQWPAKFSAFASHFGTQNLQAAISQWLTTHTVRELPEIMRCVESKLGDVLGRLAEFPDPPQWPTVTVSQEIQKIVSAVSRQVEGTGLDMDFRNDIRGIIASFSTNLSKVQSDAVLSTPGWRKPAFSVDDDDVDDQNEDRSTPVSTPNKRQRAANGRAVNVTPLSHSRVKREPQTIQVPQLKDVQATLRLDYVRDRYVRGSRSNLLSKINPEVTDSLILSTIGGWPVLAEFMLSKVLKRFKSMLQGCVDSALSSRAKTQLYAQTVKAVDAFYTRLADEQAALVRRVVQWEMHKPTTFDNHRLAQIERLKEKELLHKRLECRVNEKCDEIDATMPPNKALDMEARKEKQKNAKFLGELKDEEWDREVSAIAQIQAYYELASKGLVDTIAKLLERDLLHQFGKDLESQLAIGLNVADPDWCAKLLAEDPKREAERHKLLAEKKKLEEALGKLQSWRVRY